MPVAGTPLDHAALVRILTSLAGTGEFVMVVTQGREHKGLGVINVRDVPPGKELAAIDNSASVLPPGHFVHALYAGDLITMQGSHTS